MARVTMKDGTLKKARIAPAPAPMQVPDSTTASTASHKGQSKVTTRVPKRAEENAMAEPTLTSISPATMNSVMP